MSIQMGLLKKEYNSLKAKEEKIKLKRMGVKKKIASLHNERRIKIKADMEKLLKELNYDS